MRKGRILKILAVVIVAVMVLGCLSVSGNTTYATGDEKKYHETNHIDIRTDATYGLDDKGQLVNSGVTLPAANITYVGYKTGNASTFTALTQHNEELKDDGRINYETKFGTKNYGGYFCNVYDSTLVVEIKGTFSNGEEFDAVIDQGTVYPAGTLMKYEYSNSEANDKHNKRAMAVYGAKTVQIDGVTYYDVSGVSIIDVAVAMCNGVGTDKDKNDNYYIKTVCGLDFYLSPTVIKNIDPDELTVKKSWTNVEGDLIPADVTVQLFKDDVAVEGKTATLSADNDWTAVIKYTKEGDGYTVKETAIDGVAVENTAFSAKEDNIVSYGEITFTDDLVWFDPVETTFDGFYFVESLDNAFGISRLNDNVVLNDSNPNKNLKYVVWTYKELGESDKQVFIDGINNSGDLAEHGYPNDVLTLDNCAFISGDNTTFTYSVDVKSGTYTYEPYWDLFVYYDYFETEAEATSDMNDYIDYLGNEYVTSNSKVYVVSGELKEKEPKRLNSSKDYTDKKENKAKKKAQDALDKAIADLSKDQSVSNIKGELDYKGKSGKNYLYGYHITYNQTVDTRKWGYSFDWTKVATKTIKFEKESQFFSERDGRDLTGVIFTYSDRRDWDYLYDGRFASESTPDENLWKVENTYVGETSITGSKTFDMQGYDNEEYEIYAPVNADGTPKINIEVTKVMEDVNGEDNSQPITDFSIEWKQVDNSNTWNFTITGAAITPYYDKDGNDKYDSVATYTIKEKGENGGVIKIDNFDYNVSYDINNNAITNTLDTSGFTGDLTINKTIDDVNPVNGKAIFTYKVEGEGKTYYAVIVVDSETKTGSTTLKGLKIGNYTVTELNTMRFAQTSVTPDGGAASVTKDGEATVDFTNALKVRTNFSHTDVTVNHFTKTADGISTKRDGDNETNNYETRTAIVAPAYR